MIRRTRRVREIPFSFDSFLDVVANVVGIIIRLILVVWVGARSYSSVKDLAPPTAAVADQAAALDLKDPLEIELARHRQELAQAQARLLEQLRELQLTQGEEQEVSARLGTLKDRAQGLDQEQAGLERAAGQQALAIQNAQVSFTELQQRRQKLTEELRALEKQPRKQQELRYRTPVSRPVSTDEFFFECKGGRVTFIDIASLVAEMRRGAEEKVEEFRERWQLTQTTGPVGAFRLRYTLERQRELLETLADTAPGSRENYRVLMSGWELEPIQALRGETVAQALAPGSQFRQVVDKLDPQLAAVTFWVYPDSFALFRQLRDHLYERDLIVAGRPLPDGYPIRCSRTGSRSRAQ